MLIPMISAIIDTNFLLGITTGLAVSYFLWKKLFKSVDEDAVSITEPEDFFDELQMVFCVRNDLGMGKGKIAAQCGHAAVAAYVKANKLSKKVVNRWMKSGGAKITLKVQSETELLNIEKSAKNAGLLTVIIRDAGHTQVVPGSKTVLAIGPAPKTQFNQITGHLKLL